MQRPDYSLANVLVVGDMMLDRYWYGDTARISPEAPVPVVHVQGIEQRAGGAGNVAVNLAALGVQVSVLGYCGCDEAGDALVAALDQAGIQCLIEPQAGVPTITKLRVLSRHQQLIRMDFEDRLDGIDPAGLLEHYTALLEQVDAVVLSDYGKGTLRIAPQLIALARAAATPVLVDPKGLDFSIYQNATLVTPNLHEFEAVAGTSQDEADLVQRGVDLVRQLGLDAVLVTRGEQGMSLMHTQFEPLHLSAHAREVYDVTGAGDTVIAVLAAGLATGQALADATQLANLAAGIVVGKLGTAAVTAEELAQAMQKHRAVHQGVVDRDELSVALAAARSNREKIVVTNGCFDILHVGHIQYLQQAKALGDRLVVLVNSDASVSRLKGPERPVNQLEQRMQVLAALACVDWVIAFDTDTPRELICDILPDVLVKGGDYSAIEHIAGHDCVVQAGGEVRLLDCVEGVSTTHLIQNIRDK